MNNEYVIINKTEWSKVMETNQKPGLHYDGIYVSEAQNARADLIEKILSKSTPLIPEIKKSYTKGFSEGIVFGMNTEYKYKTSEDYITNLKLDI